jgi:benzoyl-CoA reductase subunit C
MINGLERVEQLYEDRGQRARELKADGKGIIGYLCTFTPVEIITAAGLVPFRVTGSRQQSITKAGTHLESIACPFTRSVLDMALKEEYAFFDGFVMPHACDNIVTLYDLWSQNIEHSYGHFVNVPHTLSEPSMVFFEAELNTFKTSLERYTGKEISDEDLHGAIRLHNEQRSLVRQLYDFRRNAPPSLSGAETIKIIIAAMSLPVNEANDLLKGVISEIGNRGPDQGANNGTRLMIHGTGIDNTTFIEMVEEAGASIVVDDLCFGTRPYWYEVQPTDNPLKGIARSYLEGVNCPRTYRQSPGSHEEDLENRFGHIYKLASDFDVKGVIFHILQYCDTHAFDIPDLKEYVEGKGLPVLHIEEDYPISSIARLKTRVEAFLEMVE